MNVDMIFVVLINLTYLPNLVNSKISETPKICELTLTILSIQYQGYSNKPLVLGKSVINPYAPDCEQNLLFQNNSLSNLLLNHNNDNQPLYFDLRAKNIKKLLRLLDDFSKMFDILSQNSFRIKPKIFIKMQSLELQDIIQNQLPTLNTRFPIDSEVYFLFYNGSRTVSVWELYMFKTLLRYQLVTNVNQIEPEEFATDLLLMRLIGLIFEKPISTRRENLEEVELTAVAQNDPDYQPRIKTKIHANGSVEFVAGMCLEVFKIMQIMMKFSFRAIDGRGWMALFPNGTWTGMSGQVVNGEADISISQASIIMMADQLHGITFLHPTSKGELVAIFRQPSASSIRDIIGSAFQPWLWLCYFMIWIVLLICLRIIFKFIYNYGDSLTIIDQEFMSNSPLWAISATCNSGWHITPCSFPIRLIFTMGFFLGSFMLVGYCASLVTNLSTEAIPIKNDEDLIASLMEIYADKWLPMAQRLMEDMYKLRRKVLQKSNTFYDQLEFLIPSVLKKSRAFITFTDAISVVFHRLNYTDVFFCNSVYTIVVSKVPYPNAMYVKRRSPLREIFNTRILLMIERGSLSRFNRIYDTQTQILCIYQHHRYRSGLAMRDTTTPFIILASGFLLSLLICITEKKPWKVDKALGFLHRTKSHISKTRKNLKF